MAGFSNFLEIHITALAFIRRKPPDSLLGIQLTALLSYTRASRCEPPPALHTGFPLNGRGSSIAALRSLLIQPFALFLCPWGLAQGCLSASRHCCHCRCIQVAAKPAAVYQLIQPSLSPYISSTCAWNPLGWALELPESAWSRLEELTVRWGLDSGSGGVWH